MAYKIRNHLIHNKNNSWTPVYGSTKNAEIVVPFSNFTNTQIVVGELWECY